MNQRIRELIEEATMITEVWNDEVGAKRYLQLNEEKFAELIVEECINVCKSRVGNSDYNTGRMHCASDIKEHFGIK